MAAIPLESITIKDLLHFDEIRTDYKKIVDIVWKKRGLLPFSNDSNNTVKFSKETRILYIESYPELARERLAKIDPFGDKRIIQ